jgi:hypothetical protein
MTNSTNPNPSLAVPARVTFTAPGCSPITLSARDIAELVMLSDGRAVELFGITYTRVEASA